ncbi:MAG: hypothetical protein LC778_10860 [Acidobacteria bacterium]|nr:hypothetical protein [Acidobacteriota bacterium]
MAVIRKLTLRINQETQIDSPDIGFNFKFLSVVEDSRCPEGVDCIWEGNARLQLQMSLTKTNNNLEIFELNTNLEPQSIRIEDYEIKILDLIPKPKVDLKIERENYMATFTVTNLKIVTDQSDFIEN